MNPGRKLGSDSEAYPHRHAARSTYRFGVGALFRGQVLRAFLECTAAYDRTRVVKLIWRKHEHCASMKQLQTVTNS